MDRMFGIFASIISALITFAFLKFPSKLITCVAVAVLTYLLYQCFVLDKKYDIIVKQGLSLQKIWTYLPIILYGFSIIFLLGSGVSDYLFLNWNSIPFISWLKLGATLLFTTFLPGYFILNIVDSKREISEASFLSLIPLLSIFFTSLMAFIVIRSGHAFISVVTPLILFNTILLILYVFLVIHKRVNTFSNPKFDKFIIINFTGKLVLLVLVVILFIGIYTAFFTNQSFLRGDMWRDFALAVRFSKFDTGFVETNELGRPILVPYWFELYLATIFVISDFPLVNSHIVFAFFNVFSVIAFYSLAKTFFDDEECALFSTVVWSLFSGLGWIYVLNSLSQSMMGQELNWLEILAKGEFAVPWSIGKPFGFWANDVSGLRAQAFISLLMLLTITLNGKISLRKVCLITYILVCFSYLIHVFEAAVFVLIFWPLIALFSNRRPLRENMYISLSIVAGLLSVYFIDLISIYYYYRETYLVYLILFAVATTIVIYILSKSRFKLKIKWDTFTRNIPRVAMALLLFLYVLAIIIHIASDFYYSGYMMNMRMVPWYIYPLKLGVAGLIMVTGIGIIVLRGGGLSRDIKFLLVTILTLLVFGKIVSYIKVTYFSFPYEEMRTVDEMFPIVALATGWILAKAFSKMRSLQHMRSHFMKKMGSGLFIALIIASGSLSSLLSPEFWALTTGPWGGVRNLSEGEVEAVNFLRLNCKPDAIVATVPGSGDKNIVSLAGLQALENVGVDMAQRFFEVSGSATFFGIASTWNIQYIYISEQGYQLLRKYFKDYFFFREVLPTLPVAFNKSGITLYHLITPPQYESRGYSITSLNMTLAGKVQLKGIFGYLEEEHTPLVLSDDNQSNVWSCFGVGSGKWGVEATDDYNVKVKGENSLKISVTDKGTYARWQLSYDFGSSRNLSTYDIIALYWYGANTNKQLIIRLDTTPNDWLGYAFIDNFSGWKRLVFQLKKPNYIAGSPTLRSIRWIDIHPYPDEEITEATYYMDRVLLDIEAFAGTSIGKKELQVELLVLSGDVLLDGIPVLSPHTFSNVTVTNISFEGSSSITLETNKVQVAPAPAETYVDMYFPEYFNYVLNVSDNATAKLVIKEGNQIHNIIVKDGTVRIERVRSIKYLRGKVPIQIIVNGTTYINKPIFYWTPKLREIFNLVGPLSFKPSLIEGIVAFKLVGADHETLFIDDSTFNINAVTLKSTSVVKEQHPSFLELETPKLSFQVVLLYSLSLFLILEAILYWFSKMQDGNIIRAPPVKWDGKKDE
jgi:hypothetical protein